MGEAMPKHITSGLKYLAAVELKKKGYNQLEISQELGMDRSTVSHYLNGRNLSLHSIEVADTISNLCPKDFLILTTVLFQDEDKARKIVSICSKNKFEGEINDSCIGCGLCVDLCLMKAIQIDDLKAQLDSNSCCGCLICEERCPTNSINILEVD